jgi:ATP-dependent protease HslVU (ClpYQ) peptidase subunit
MDANPSNSMKDGRLTVIAGNREMVAGDTLVVHDDRTVSTHRKVHVVRDMIVGYAGCLDSGVRFLGWVKRGMGSRGKPNDLSDQFTGLILDEDGIYEYRFQLVSICVEGDCWAIGSGAQAALGAMFMGADPEEAAEVACAIDPFCGGPVTVERL